MVDLQTHHTFSSCCGVRRACMGPPRDERDERTSRSLGIMSKIPRSSLLLRQKQVLIVQSLRRATGGKGQRLRLTSEPLLVRENMLQTYNSVTLDWLPGDAELPDFKAAVLFCSAAGFWLSRVKCRVLINAEFLANA